jgi:hypothetical protein
MSPEKKADRFPCPGCSADMQFEPATGGMKCPFCGKTQTLAPATTPGRPAGIASHSLDEFLAKQGDSHLSTLSSQSLEVSCAACGSAVTFQPPEVAGSCRSAAMRW